MDKAAIRERILRLRRQLDPMEAETLGLQAQRRLLALGAFSAAHGVALYSPIHNEVATKELHAAVVAAGKKVFYPRISGGKLEFAQVGSLADLVPGRFGVREPVAAATTRVAEIDLIVIPGIAFDRRGHRLGYGRGYYDRYLAAAAEGLVKIGFCYSFQLCGGLPEERHDQRLDCLVTDAAVISCHEDVPGST